MTICSFVVDLHNQRMFPQQINKCNSSLQFITKYMKLNGNYFQYQNKINCKLKLNLQLQKINQSMHTNNSKSSNNRAKYPINLNFLRMSRDTFKEHKQNNSNKELQYMSDNKCSPVHNKPLEETRQRNVKNNQTRQQNFTATEENQVLKIQFLDTSLAQLIMMQKILTKQISQIQRDQKSSMNKSKSRISISIANRDQEKSLRTNNIQGKVLNQRKVYFKLSQILKKAKEVKQNIFNFKTVTKKQMEYCLNDIKFDIERKVTTFGRNFGFKTFQVKNYNVSGDWLQNSKQGDIKRIQGQQQKNRDIQKKQNEFLYKKQEMTATVRQVQKQSQTLQTDLKRQVKQNVRQSVEVTGRFNNQKQIIEQLNQLRERPKSLISQVINLYRNQWTQKGYQYQTYQKNRKQNKPIRSSSLTIELPQNQRHCALPKPLRRNSCAPTNKANEIIQIQSPIFALNQESANKRLQSNHFDRQDKRSQQLSQFYINSFEVNENLQNRHSEEFRKSQLRFSRTQSNTTITNINRKGQNKQNGDPFFYSKFETVKAKPLNYHTLSSNGIEMLKNKLGNQAIIRTNKIYQTNERSKQRGASKPVQRSKSKKKIQVISAI